MHMIKERTILKRETKKLFDFLNITNVLKHFKMKSMTLLIGRREYQNTFLVVFAPKNLKLLFF